MGADIHVIVEVRNSNNGRWYTADPRGIFVNSDNYESYNDYYDEYPNFIWSGRYYEFFAQIGGVRGKNPEFRQFHNRGIPNNISFESVGSISSYGGDGHSHSWILLSEMEEFESKWIKDFQETIKALKALGFKNTDVRMIYYFDN